MRRVVLYKHFEVPNSLFDLILAQQINRMIIQLFSLLFVDGAGRLLPLIHLDGLLELAGSTDFGVQVLPEGKSPLLDNVLLRRIQTDLFGMEPFYSVALEHLFVGTPTTLTGPVEIGGPLLPFDGSEAGIQRSRLPLSE